MRIENDVCYVSHDDESSWATFDSNSPWESDDSWAPEDYKDDGGLSEFEETPWDKYECWSSKERRHFDRKKEVEHFVASKGALPHAGPVEQRLRRTYRAFLKEDKMIFLAEAKAREGRKGKRPCYDPTKAVGL